jgi:dihydropteroate synthase
MIWKTATRTFDLRSRGLIMGVLNVTTDSFSDGGCFIGRDLAVAHGQRMAAQGADIIDVGGESTRPGAEPVSEQEELDRVLPVIEALAPNTQIVLSIDTMKPAVARAAMAAGCAIINDVSGLQNAEMRDAVRESGAGAIAMHMQGTPRTMQLAPRYGDVVAEIRDYFRQTFEACLRSQIDPMRLAFDPGIGFGKTVTHNLALIRNLAAMRVGERPLVLGASRKSFISKVTGAPAMEDREWPTIALTSYGSAHGANIVRVHNVQGNAEAMRMTEAFRTLEGTG